ncbi:glycosyltransferase family 2 protein [Candidatus Pacearchaeota archaeon]|nr:glycosyltransferase family 2 protein [Candidatus Pacearchaeota archaeon]
MKYNISDIRVIIATYNRSEDLEITLKSFKNEISSLSDVMIVDQSTNKLTYEVVKKLKNKKIRYYHSKTPSLTLARNLGIKKIHKKSKILLFLDDDVSLGKNYFSKLIEVFNFNKGCVGVGGYYFPKDKTVNKFLNSARKLFFIEHWDKNSAKTFSVYGAGYPSKLTKVINSSWLPGFNMAFKKEVFKNNLFDERFFRYALAEDFEFGTRLNKKYPNGLFITPYAPIIHRVSTAERMPTPKLAYMNHVNHFYIQSKVFNDLRGIITFGVALFGMSLLQIIGTILLPTKTKLLKCKLYFKALAYCFKRLHLIRRGNLEIPLKTG